MKIWMSFIAFFVLVACSKKEAGIKAQINSITESVYASGTIKAQQQYQVFANVNGILRKAFVSEGDLVKQGDPLFLIDNNTSSLNSENARLALDLSAQNIRGNSNRLRELELPVNLAKEKLQNDSSMYSRQKNLWEKSIGTRVELEQRQLAFETSKANYLSALSRLKQAKLQFNTEYRQAQNNLKISKEFESNYTIRSETDGMIYDILKEQGELITSQAPLAVVGNSSGFILELQVDEYDIVKMRLNQKVLITMDSYKGRVFEAKVSKIYPIMNERSRTFTIEAVFIAAPKELYPNLTLEANIIIQTKPDALIIPREYLVDEKFIFTDPDKKIKTEVKIGLMDYRYVEILSGFDTSKHVYKP